MSATPDNSNTAKRGLEELSLSGFFDALPVADIRPTTPAREKQLSEEAVIGESKLTSNGFFVRINEAAPRRMPRNAPPMVLVIEDDDATATVIVGALQSSGYQTMRAANRTQIVECMKCGPDIVLLDVLLPDTNGFDVLARLRGARDFTDLPVLMLTSLGALDDILNGLKLGANGYLTKPAKSRALLDAMKQVLS
jgi:CheY-like chemotaxis protein